MNKKGKRLLSMAFIMIFMMLISVNEVNAVKCTYGEGMGDEWKKQIVIEIPSYEAMFLNVAESPKFSSLNLQEVSTEGKTASYLMSGVTTNLSGSSITYVSYKIYKTKTTYEVAEKAGNICPSMLYMDDEFNVMPGNAMTGTPGTQQTYYYLYTDDLSKEELKSDSNKWYDWLLGTAWTKGKHVVLREEKAKDIENIESSCNTYGNYMTAIQTTIVENDGSCDNNPEFNDLYQELSQLCEYYRATATYVGEDDNVKKCSTACSGLKDDIATYCEDPQGTSYCGSLGNKIVNWIFKIVKFVRYAVPALLIILSILDYLKALASESEDEMKKVTSRFSKRLIAAILIFIIPFILDFVLRLFDIPGLNASNPFCAE